MRPPPGLPGVVAAAGSSRTRRRRELRKLQLQRLNSTFDPFDFVINVAAYMANLVTAEVPLAAVEAIAMAAGIDKDTVTLAVKDWVAWGILEVQDEIVKVVPKAAAMAEDSRQKRLAQPMVGLEDSFTELNEEEKKAAVATTAAAAAAAAAMEESLAQLKVGIDDEMTEQAEEQKTAAVAIGTTATTEDSLAQLTLILARVEAELLGKGAEHPETRAKKTTTEACSWKIELGSDFITENTGLPPTDEYFSSIAQAFKDEAFQNVTADVLQTADVSAATGPVPEVQ